MDSSTESDNAVDVEKEDLVHCAYLYITTGSYPDGCSANRKRSIRNKAKRFKLREGELHYKEIRKEGAGGGKV